MERKVKAKYGLPSIDGIVCTYETKKIRTEIEAFFKENRVFILPDRYIYKLKLQNLGWQYCTSHSGNSWLSPDNKRTWL